MAVAVKDDAQILADVQAELDWDPEIDATDVGVEVENGVVSLTGTVTSLWQKWAAERAALRVAGVRAVANDIEVQLPALGARTDADLAREVAEALGWHPGVPADRIEVVVQDGRVTLTGEVDWHHERQAAEEAARSVPGVKEIYNQIALRAVSSSPETIKEGIERALRRSALVDASLIHVRVEESRVILTGTVRSPAARAEAEATAWRAPGVTEVINELQIEAR